MKKRMISLVLVVAMLLCVLPAASAAENDPAPAFYSYYLSLSESIAIKFKFANSNENCYVTFNDGAEKVPVKNGIVTYADLSPAELAKDVKVTLYNGETEIDSKTVSALGYCSAILGGSNYSTNMKKLAADLISFGIAFRDSKDNPSEYKEITKPENFDAYVSVVEPTMEQCTPNSTFGEGKISGGVALEESVLLYVECADAEKIEFTKEGGAAVTVEPETTAKGRRFYFRGLNPAEMRKQVTVKGLDANGTEIGTLTTTIEDYAADCNAADASAELKAYADVTKAMMQYGDSAAAYVESTQDTPADAKVLLSEDFTELDSAKWTRTRYGNVSPSIEVNANGQVQFKALDTQTSEAYLIFNGTIDSSKKTSIKFELKTEGDSTNTFQIMLALKDTKTEKTPNAVWVGFQSGFLYAGTKTSTTVTAGQCYDVEVITDPEEKTFEVRLDGNLIKKENYMNSLNTWDQLRFIVKGNNSGKTLSAYIDNLVVTEVAE